MRTAIVNLLLVLSTLLILGGCSEDEPDGIEHQPNYVSEYLVPESISMKHCFIDTDTTLLLDSNRVLRIEILGEETKSADEVEFYSKKFGDRSYNAYPNFASLALNQAVQSINITCDQAYDAEHPAGTSLSDLLIYQTFSYATVIANNYICTPPYWYDYSTEGAGEYLNWNDEYFELGFSLADVISTPLSTFNQTSHILLNPVSHIKFIKDPTTTGTLTFQVEIQLEDITTPLRTTFTSIYE